MFNSFFCILILYFSRKGFQFIKYYPKKKYDINKNKNYYSPKNINQFSKLNINVSTKYSRLEHIKLVCASHINFGQVDDYLQLNLSQTQIDNDNSNSSVHLAASLRFMGTDIISLVGVYCCKSQRASTP